MLFPIGASQALPLYGRGYNFCFQAYDPGRAYSYDEYTQHVATFLDADWLLKNNIRYFHLPKGDLSPNHGLSRALEIGLLQPVRTVSSSGVYQVRPIPWTPRVMSIPPAPGSSHQVRWLADGSGVADGSDPQLVFTLERRSSSMRFVSGTRSPIPQALPASAQLFWKRAISLSSNMSEPRVCGSSQNAEEETLTILVHDTLDQFRFDPDIRPATFRMREIELLVKPPDIP